MAQPAQVHRRGEERPRPEWGGLVALQQGGGPGQVLGEFAVLGPAGGLAQSGIPVRGSQLVHDGLLERFRHRDMRARQQLPCLRMRVPGPGWGGVGFGRAGERVPVLGPHRAQHQYRGPVGVGEQGSQPGGHPLTGVAALGEQVELRSR